MFLTFGLLLLHCTENAQVTGQDLPTVLPQTANSTACDVPGAFRCFSEVNITAQPLIQMFGRGDVSNITVGDLQRICWSLQYAYYCIGAKLDVCPMAIHLWRDIVLSGYRFICNNASQDFIDSLGCLYKISKANTTMQCASQIDMTEWSKYFTGQKSLVDNKEEFCGVASKWSGCYMESVRSVCNARENDFVYRMMTQLTTPIKTYLQCDVMTVQDLATVLPQTNSSTECDVNGAVKCFSGINITTHPLAQKFATGDISNITVRDVQSIGMSLQDSYFCIGTKLDACPMGIHLLRDIVLSGSRFICNDASQGFIDSAGCLYKVSKANMTMNCASQVDWTEWGKYFSGQKSITNNSQEFCGLTSKWSACYMESVRSVCTARENDFVYRYMTQLTTPIKTYTQCDVMVAPNTNVSVNNCDINGARMCMAQINATSPMLSIFGSAGNTNLKADQLQRICKSFEDAYLCVGTKLDGCSMEIRLLRDVILRSSRYICNAASQEFIDSLGCMRKLLESGAIGKCFNEPIGSEWNAYFGGVKKISSNYDDFCNILNNLTSCYMNSISSLCTTRDYNFIYKYWKEMSAPLTQCTILPGPTTPGATTPFPVTTAKRKRCYYRGVHVPAKLRRKMDKWCRQNCKRGYCPRSICRCDRKASSRCFAIGIFRKVPAADYWCIENCQRGNCPRDRCRCKRRF